MCAIRPGGLWRAKLDPFEIVLRAAVATGVNHIDTIAFYGLHVANRIIHKALVPVSCR